MSERGTTKGIRVPGGRIVRPETEFEFGDIADIADRHGLIWSMMLRTPLVLAAGCQLDLFKLACKTAGVEVPSPLTAEVMAEAFIDVDDAMPEEYTDGGLPKEDAPETT